MLHRNVFSQFFFSGCYVITLVARTVHNVHCTWCLLVYPTLTFPIYLSQPPQTNGHYWIFPTISQFLNKHQCIAMFMLSKLTVFNWERFSFYKDDYKTGLYLTSVKIFSWSPNSTDLYFWYLFPHIPQFLQNSGWTQGWRKKAVSEGVKPIESLPRHFCGLVIHIKNTFCKKIGSKWSFQPSAVVRAIYISLYGVATAN